MSLDKNEFRKYAIKHHRIGSQHVDGYLARVGQQAGQFTAQQAGQLTDQPTGQLPQSMTPYIIEERQLNVAQMDVFSRLMMDRIIFLGDPVSDPVANIIQAQLLFLQSADAKRDIQIYINSPGGSVYAGLGIYDTMQYIAPDVATICTGMAASMAAVLLCAGAKGKRAALPHSRVMIHQPSGGAQGVASDMEINLREMLKLKNELYEIIAQHSGNTYEWVEKSSDRDYWMTAPEAVSHGMVDEVLGRNKKEA